jgi:hypothetical protein
MEWTVDWLPGSGLAESWGVAGWNGWQGLGPWKPALPPFSSELGRITFMLVLERRRKEPGWMKEGTPPCRFCTLSRALLCCCASVRACRHFQPRTVDT